MDTQWPRFEVFKQDTPDQPYQNVGTVHAPDPEMALLNARDVYGRRPNCHSMWVAPEKSILKITSEELSDPHTRQLLAEARPSVSSSGHTIKYYVFQKLSQKRSMTFVNFTGEIKATSLRQALALALEQFGAGETWVWWICPTSAITSTEPEVEESWFAPANDKVYRQQSYYGKVKRQRRDERLQIAQELEQGQARLETEVAPK